MSEQTFIMVKPDGVQRGLVGEIVKRFEQRGYQLVAAKFIHAPLALLEEHYGELKAKPFFPKMVQYMSSSPVFAMVWQGKDVVVQGRRLLGETNPLTSAPGTIRGDFGIDIGRNICHGSDSVASAEREVKLWFPEGTVSYQKATHPWIYE